MESDIKAKLLDRKTIATGTILLTLKPSKKIDFQPGQYFWLILSELVGPDPKGNTRAFSTTSPVASDTLSFVYRTSESAYKRTLEKFQPGTNITIRGPRGSFIPQPSESQLVCLAGGTGIAPFISLAESRTAANSGQQVHIFAYNSTTDREILASRLKELSVQNPNIKYYSTTDEFKWPNISSNIGPGNKTKFLVSGPEGFVTHVTKLLKEAGINSDDVQYEEFFNHTPNTIGLPEEILDIDFRRAVEESPNHIIFTDPDGRIVFANQAAQQITGYSFSEMQGNTPRLWGGLMSKEFYQDLWDTIKKNLQPFKGQVKNIRKNGQIYYSLARISPVLNSQGTLMGFIGTEEDVTEYVNTSSDLIRSRDELTHHRAKDQAIFKSLTSGLVVTDVNGRIQMVNQAFENMLGWTQSEVVGKDMLDVLVKVDENGQKISREKRSLTLVLNRNRVEVSQSNISKTHSYLTKSGSLLPIIGTVTPIVINGELSGAVQIFYDITKNKEIDELKSDFIHLASHQLRTPLTSIRWNLELLRKTSTNHLPADQQQVLENAYKSTLSLVEIVNTLLNISRIESGRLAISPEPTDLKVLIEEVVTTLTPSITEKHQTLNFDFDKNIPQLSLDAKLVKNVYLNLISNSIKYSPENGLINLKVTLSGLEIVSEVSDTGLGIPANEQNRIFEKFFRASNASTTVSNGSGIGLYLAKTVIESCGGKIWFSSNEGHGTSFFFTLPVRGMTHKEGMVTLQT